MSRIDDVRKAMETAVGALTPAKAQQLAKGLLEPDAAKEQVAKTAGDLLEWSQRNRRRIRDLVRGEIRAQLEQVGVASRADLDALKKRVRELERASGMTASSRRTTKTKASTAGGASTASKKPSSSSRKKTAAGATKRRSSSATSSGRSGSARSSATAERSESG